MPSIDITQDQAAALARGESISIAPAPLIVVAVNRKTGSVYLLTGARHENDARSGRYRSLREPLLPETVGRSFPQGLFPDSDYTFVEVPR